MWLDAECPVKAALPASARLHDSVIDDYLHIEALHHTSIKCYLNVHNVKLISNALPSSAHSGCQIYRLVLHTWGGGAGCGKLLPRGCWVT
jgi:hypothetical protein